MRLRLSLRVQRMTKYGAVTVADGCRTDEDGIKGTIIDADVRPEVNVVIYLA